MTAPHELSAAQLRRITDPQALHIQTTAELDPLDGIIGQERAVAALRFGLGIRDNGFNIYVAGPPGSGKMTAVQAFIEELARRKAPPQDWCYVNNFEDPYQPRAIALPAGRGHKLQQDMKALIAHARREIPRAFESDDYSARRDEIAHTLNARREELLSQLNERAERDSFALQLTPFGILLAPVADGRPLGDAEFQALPSPDRDKIMAARERLQEDLKSTMKQIRAFERAAQQQLQELDSRVALYVAGGLMDDLCEEYRELPEVVAYFKALQQDILDHIAMFRTDQQANDSAGDGVPGSAAWMKEQAFRRYQVNVVVDNSRCDGAPVIVELNPTYTNLFGRIEKETQFGSLYTDFTMIKAGALQRATGGYLVLPVEDLLRNFLSWDGLKRALRSHVVQIEEPGEQLGLVVTKSLRPQPIPLDLKTVLVGSPLLYYLLHTYDESFPQLFKVKADFDTVMDRTDEHVHQYLRLVATFCAREQLRPLDAGALAALLDYSARLAEDQEKLSTLFGQLSDVIREASYWAEQESAELVGAPHVRKALDEQVYRVNLIQERVHELIERAILNVSTSGETVGQVNGLAVISMGELTFGRPTRITATVGPGRGGIVDIEREVQLGGPIHSKGVLILSGYLAHRYAQNQPLTLSARLTFEQSYEEVEGDSASSAELYALLSALAGIPIRQGIAVTGSVSQHGDVQAIGGVNQKIEGFFDICRARQLTGDQGVIIPRSNTAHLMLRDDVVAAVQQGQFHIWPVETIDEGIAILTGVSAGAPSFEGRYPSESVNGRVERRLRQFAASMKEEQAGVTNNGGLLTVVHR